MTDKETVVEYDECPKCGCAPHPPSEECGYEPGWSYDAYWAMVFGKRDAEEVVAAFDLHDQDERGTGEWLEKVERQAWLGKGSSPEEWSGHQRKALVELLLAKERVMAEVPYVYEDDGESPVCARTVTEAIRRSRGRS